MKLFNIGTQEITFLIILMLVFLGPGEMKRGAKSLGRIIRRITRSDTWRSILSFYNDVREYPQQLMDELEVEELQKDIQNEITQIKKNMDQETDDSIRAINLVYNEQRSEITEISQTLKDSFQSENPMQLVDGGKEENE